MMRKYLDWKIILLIMKMKNKAKRNNDNNLLGATIRKDQIQDFNFFSEQSFQIKDNFD